MIFFEAILAKIKGLLANGQAVGPSWIANFITKVEFTEAPLPLIANGAAARDLYSVAALSHAEYATFLGLGADSVKVTYGKYRHPSVKGVRTTRYKVKITHVGGIIEERMLYEPLLEGTSLAPILTK